MDVIALVVSAVAAILTIPIALMSYAVSRRAVQESKLLRDEHAQLRAEQMGYEGSNFCVNYRNQVLALHDRGLSTDQIRTMLYLEDDFAGVERGCGSIEDILKALGTKTRPARMSPRRSRS